MRYSKNIVETVNRNFQRKREDGFNKLSLRKEKLYKEIPRLFEIERLLSLGTMELVKLISEGSDISNTIEIQKNKNLNFQKERAEILFKAGYPIDYLGAKFDCNICNDTGYVGAIMCECYKSELKKEAHKSFNLAALMPDAVFENFKFSYYSDKLENETSGGYSPRQNAKLILKVCKDFCNNFDKVNYNILFSGDTGIGKTFLSSAIAHNLIENGYDVVYETAGTIFTLLEDIRFNKTSDNEIRERADRFLECDLLIIDDLGAEFTTQFVVSALFNLINSRILHNKKMIISTNYSKDDIENVYGIRIFSRLSGDFKTLTLHGKDIRIIKKSV